MPEPDIAAVAGLLGEPARARMLLALMGGRALTASELALEAGVSPPTASAHLGKLVEAALLCAERQGRHRYFRLANREVARLIESLCGVAARTGTARVRTGPRDPTLREARVCYDHLAGELGVRVYEALLAQRHLVVRDAVPRLTQRGEPFFRSLGIDLDALARARRPLCRSCLDWSVRRYHLAGGLGAALLNAILERGWARRRPGSRALELTPARRRKLEAAFGLPAASDASPRRTHERADQCARSSRSA